MRFLLSLLLVAVSAGLGSGGLFAQETKPLTAEQVRDAQAKFRKERDALVQVGADKRFLPILLQKAEEFGKRADAALDAGRLLQAAEFYRQARWQLPYQSKQVPDHVQRILGDLRLRHGQEINDAAFSPDGRWLATASKDRTVKIWDMENGHETLTYYGHSDHVRWLAFSPDGKIIASAGAEPDIKLWDPATGKDIRTISPPARIDKDKDGKETKVAYTTCLIFAPDGKHLIAGNNDAAMRVYDVKTGEMKRMISEFRLPVLSLAFNKQGNVLAAAVGDGQMSVWEYPAMAENPNKPAYWTKQDLTGASYDVAFSPDNRTLARCGPEGIKLYNTPLPNSPLIVSSHYSTIHAQDQKPFKKVVYSKDGKTLFAGGSDGQIYLFNADNGERREVFRGHNGEIKSLHLDETGSVLASASSDFTVRLWRFDVVLQSRTFTGHQGPVWTADFSSDGTRIVSASADRSIKIWDAPTGTVLQTLAGHDAPVTAAIFSPDGNTIVSSGGDKVVKMWEAATGKLIRTLTGHGSTVTAVVFSPDGSKIASGGADRMIKIWDAQNGKELLTCASTESVVSAIAFSADGKLLASGHVDQTIRLHNVVTGKEQQRWTAHGEAVSGLTFSANGRWLASCGFDHLVRLWPMDASGLTAEPSLTLSGHAGPLSSVAFRKDSKYLVSCGSDTIVKLWKIEEGTAKEAQNFRGHSDWVSSVAFSPDGFYVVSSSVDRSLKVWEITSREIPLSPEHTGAVQAVAISADGKLIASGATDNRIKIWDRHRGIELRTIELPTEVYSLAFSQDGKVLASTGNDRSIRLWDTATGKELPPKANQTLLTGLLASVPLISIPPPGKTLLAWIPGNERYTRITAFDYDTADEQYTFQDNGRHVLAVTFSPNGSRAALGGKDGSIRVYDLEKKGQQLPGGDWLLFEKDTACGDLAFSPDAKHIVIGNDKGDVKVCEVESRKVLHTIKAHSHTVYSCAVSPNGKYFATAGLNNDVALWDLTSGKEVRRWDMNMLRQEQGAFVASMAFTPDSRNLVTANANTTVYVLELPKE